jgi:hypothetical protein
VDVIQKPTSESHFSSDPFLESYVFSKTITRDMFELMKFLHFVGNDSACSLFKINRILDSLNKRFQTVFLPAENVCIDKSLLLS